MNEQWISDVISKAMEMGRQQISGQCSYLYPGAIRHARSAGSFAFLWDGYKVGDTIFVYESINLQGDFPVQGLEVRGAKRYSARAWSPREANPLWN